MLVGADTYDADPLRDDTSPEMDWSQRSHKRRAAFARRLNVAGSYNLKFSVGVFVRELISHMLTPLSIIYVNVVLGHAYATNQLWLDKDFSMRQTLTSCLFYLVIIVYSLTTDGEMEGVAVAELVAACFLHFAHKAMIATKYALMQSHELEHIMHQQDLEFLLNSQLIYGWESPNKDQIRGEVQRASARLNVDASRVVFHIGWTPTEIRAFFGEFADLELSRVASGLNSPSGTDNVDGLAYSSSLQSNARRNTVVSTEQSAYGPHLRSVPADAVIRRLYNMSTDIMSPAPLHLYAVLGVIQALLPCVVRLCFGHWVFGGTGRGNWKATLIVLSCSYLSLVYFGTLCRFIGVGIRDYRRRLEVLRFVDVMIAPEQQKSVTEKEEDADVLAYAARGQRGMRLDSNDRFELVRARNLPVINLRIAENIMAWLAARQVIQNTGMVYRQRVRIYTTYGIFMALVILAFMVSDVVQRTIRPESVILIAYDLTVILALTMKLTAIAVESEEQFEIHRNTIVRNQFVVREMLAEQRLDLTVVNDQAEIIAENERRHSLQTCDLLLDSALKLLLVEQFYGQMKILGLSGGAITRALSAMAASGLAVLARLLTPE